MSPTTRDDLPADDPHRRLTKASDFPPEVLRLFDRYVHGQLDRRGFLDGAARHAAGGFTAAGFLAALTPRFAQAQKVKPDDARLVSAKVDVPSPDGHGTIRGLLVQPAGLPAGTRLPAVVVVHENRGLNPHIEDVARRLALERYLVLAPDALTTQGGYPGDEDAARGLFAKVDQPKVQQDFIAAARWLKAHAGSSGKLGVTGFCWGGGISNLLAARLGGDLHASVPFYGVSAPADQVGNIQAPLLIHFASNDERINAMWPSYEAALKGAGKRYEAHVYPKTEHGFHNDTTPRYDEAAAALAWKRTLEHFERTLRA